MSNLIRKTVITVTVLLSFAMSLNAQNYQDVVYLKNGSVIRGLILEQIPNQSLKIVTPDGSTFFCTFDEVEKIAKELPAAKENAGRRSQYGWLSAPRYRGFVEEAVIVGTGDFEMSRSQVSTSHGCQVSPYLFIGGGLGVNYWFDDFVTIPFFAHLRSEIHKAYNKRVSPYFDAKIGYSLGGDFDGFYCLPSTGCHIYFGKSKLGLSISIGYNVQLTRAYYYTAGISKTENLGGVAISLALDF